MTTVRTLLLLVIALICLISVSCSGAKELGKTLGSLVVVRGEIIKKFGEEGVDVRLNMGGKAISVTFVNSTLNGKGPDERERRALETAKIVKTHYPEIKSIDQIGVGFIRMNTTLYVFHQSVVLSYYGFDNEAKLLPGFGSNRYGEPEPSGPTANYSTTSRQTTIQGRAQLEGIAGHGLTMIAQFVVLGDTSKVTPKAPTNVTFDFASYAEKQQFTGVIKVVFMTDEKISYETEGQFSTSRTNDGLVSEFLYLEVPYPKFRRSVTGKTLTVKLGERKFTLTDEQFQSFQKMDQYVKN